MSSFLTEISDKVQKSLVREREVDYQALKKIG
jgi:hypothetical protein